MKALRNAPVRGSSSHRTPILPILKSDSPSPRSTRTISKTSSRSWVSAGMCWKYQRISPVSGSRASVELGVERRAFGVPLHDGPRLGLGGGPVDETRLGVVAPRDPRIGPRAPNQRQVAPGVAGRVSGAGDGRGAPQLGAGLRIVSGDEADVVLVPLAPGHPGHDLAVHDNRAAGVPVAQVAVGHLMLPDQLTRPRVEGNQLRSARARVDLVVVDGDAAPRHAGAAIDGQVLILRDGLPPRVFPDQISGGRVQRLRAAPARNVHHAGAHERGYLVGARLHSPGPDVLQVAHVLPVDLVEGAVALIIQRPAPVDPVAVVRASGSSVVTGSKSVTCARLDTAVRRVRSRRPQDPNFLTRRRDGLVGERLRRGYDYGAAIGCLANQTQMSGVLWVP